MFNPFISNMILNKILIKLKKKALQLSLVRSYSIERTGYILSGKKTDFIFNKKEQREHSIDRRLYI